MTREIRIALAITVGGAAVFLFFQRPEPNLGRRSEAGPASDEIAGGPSAMTPAVLPGGDLTAPVEPNVFTDPAPAFAPEFDLSDESLPWERRIEAITGAAGVSDGMKARLLLEMLPSLPEEALDVASREAVERLPDQDYLIAQIRLTHPQTHGMVMSVLFADLLERPDAIALPALLVLARMPTHPLAAEARANLELLTAQDFGRDWARWEGEVQRLIAKRNVPLPR